MLNTAARLIRNPLKSRQRLLFNGFQYQDGLPVLVSRAMATAAAVSAKKPLAGLPGQWLLIHML